MSIRRDAADDWFSKCVRKRANWTCEHSQKTEALQCAHIIGRREKSVRWDGMNAVCLSASSHRYFTENPLDFARWLEGHLGLTHLEILNEKRRHKLKTTRLLRRDIAKHYREQFNSMEDGGDFVSWI